MREKFLDFILWDEICVKILRVKHGLLVKQHVSYIFENSLFLFVAGKNGHVQIGEVPYAITSNRLFHIGPNKDIDIVAEKKEMEYFIVVYQPELGQSAGREMLRLEIQKSPFIRCFSAKVSNKLFFMEQFSNMVDIWNQSSLSHRLQLKQCFYSIVNQFYKELETSGSSREEVDIVEKISQYLKKNFSKSVSLQALADMEGISRITLYEQFRQRLGYGPQEYLMQLRLNEACRILIEEEMSLNDIAVCCGLRDKSYFSRVFKQKYGMSPGSYRSKHRIVTSKDKEEEENLSKVIENECNVLDRKMDNEAPKYLLIENFGRIHRYYNTPQRIVCLDYAAAEFCVALDMTEQIVAVASAETAFSDCMLKYRDQISRLPFIYGRSSNINVPDFETVRNCRPDLVIGSAYGLCNQTGVADAETFEQFGIHVYALQGTCMVGSTYEEVYTDIKNLGKIFGKETHAEKLIKEMKIREFELEKRNICREHPVRVFVFDSSVNDMAFTCGQSIESHIISSAGGINIFGDRKQQFASVHWSEIAKRNPEAILVHRFYEGRDALQKIALLKRVSEIKEVDAIKNNCIYTVGIKKVFPAIDNVETAYELSEWFHTGVLLKRK